MDIVTIGLNFGDVNWTGVIVAGIACWASGFVWFGPKTLFPVWWKAMGKGADEEPGAGQNMGMVFGLVTLSALVQAYLVAVVAGAVAGGLAIAPGTGATVGFVLGLLVTLPALGHRLFAGHGLKVWVLECGNDLLNFVLMGLVYALIA